MAATIKIKNSSTAGAAPTSSDLVQGELAVNVTDKRLFTENSGGTVVELGTNPSSITLPDGSASAPTLLHSGDTNTGLFFPAADTIALTTGGSERLRLDSSGNLGLGVTPSAWRSTEKALQIGNAAVFLGRSDTLVANMASNWYVTSGRTNTYIATGNATLYQQLVGEHRWFNAASGTAGNAITFTQAMTLNASGSLLLNTTSSPTYGGAGSVLLNNATAVDLEFNISNTLTGYIYAQSTNFQVGSATSIPLIFLTGNSERARITSSGDLLVGCTAAPTNGTPGIFISSPASNGIISGSNTTASTLHVRYFNNNGQVGSITTSGSATTYATSSDYRLKHGIAPMVGALSKVSALKPCTYKWNADGADGEGFIAHELAEVCPQAVVGAKDAVDQDGNPVYQGIDTSFLIATLTAAIQELNAQQAALKAEFDAYKAAHP